MQNIGLVSGPHLTHLQPDGQASPCLVHERLEQHQRILLQRLRNGEELDDVDPALPALVLRYEGLRAPQPPGDLMLGETSISAGCSQQLSERAMLGRMDGSAHAAPEEDDERDKLILLLDYPK